VRNLFKLVTLILHLMVMLLAACSLTQGETGILQGDVSVGPLSPVVGPGVEEPTPGPEVYADRKVVVFNAKGTRELQQVDILADGTYSVELAVGTYVIDINRLGIDHGMDLPATIEIRANQVTVIDIDIDTGIR
jgi:hypothetical protein